jgi:hypothetical protein
MATLYAATSRRWIEKVSRIAEQTAAIMARKDVPIDAWELAMRANSEANYLLASLTFSLVEDTTVVPVPAIVAVENTPDATPACVRVVPVAVGISRTFS